MAALTATGTIRENVGSMTFYLFSFTSVNTGDTFASGLGANVIAFNAVMSSGPTTQASAGYAVLNSTGTFTLKPGEDGNAAVLQVTART